MSEKKTVLVVDDDTQSLGMIGEVLEVLGGYDILKAERIEAGYVLFTEYREQIHAILMDGDMPPGPPEMRTTIDLVRAIRRYGFAGTIVAISGNPEQQGKLCAPRLCDRGLAKPFQIQQLLEMLRA